MYNIMAVSFSTDSTELYKVIGNNVACSTTATNVITINSFHIDRCVTWIDGNQFEKVALQFPDNLLCVADELALIIQHRVIKATIFILADTSYGSCCVDEVAAEHVSSNALIHFGSACLTPGSRLPVLYVFGEGQIDCENAADEFSLYFTDKSRKILLVYDVVFRNASSRIYNLLKDRYPNLILSKLMVPGEIDDDDDVPVDQQKWFVFGRRKCRLSLTGENFEIGDHAVFYVGHDGPTLTNLLMTVNRCEFVVYDPERRKSIRENVNISRALQKRYYLIERARDAQLVGILVGTLGVRGYLDIIERMKSLAKHAGKRSYTIVVGRLNPAKLANFPEIDVFVLIACAENSLLDSKEFFRPIVTPFEFEVACNEARQWTGDYVTDFTQLMEGARHYTPIDGVGEQNETRTSMSLITGKMNRLYNTDQSDGNVADSTTGSLLLTDSTVSTIHNNAGGDFLMQRSWRGLEQNLGKDDVVLAQQGQSGIASGYKNEGK